MRRVTLQKIYEDNMASRPSLIILSLFPIFFCCFFLYFGRYGWLGSLSIVNGKDKSLDMAWPWQFVTLSEEELSLRRQLLDRYGVYAQLSAVVPVLLFLLYRLGIWVSSQRQRVDPGYEALPNRADSVPRKKQRLSSTSALKGQWRSFLWWLDGEALTGWGKRGHWIAGTLWASWLLFLSVHQTGDDYLHVTKRFGIVAASQLPVHYMLSMKSLYSPFAIAFRSSHEQLNPYHRISGRIIYSLLILHLSFYMNFFIRAGLLKVRFTQLIPLLGVLAFTLLTILATTSLARVRRWSYRVFFILHLMSAISVLPVLFFHAKPIRFYLAESLILFALDITARKLDTFTGFSHITQVMNTKLVKLIIPVSPSKIRRFQAAPGQHVYLSLPPESTPTTTSLPSIHDLMYNPFTVAEVSSDRIMLVLRTLHGPTTTALQHLTRLTKARPGINIEGPYGESGRFPNFAAEFDKILLVAGGVGATFILPIFNHITSSILGDEHNSSSVEMIWSMRSTAEAGWVVDTGNPNVLEDPRVKIYITGDDLESSESSASYAGVEDGSIGMGDLRREDRPGRVNEGHTRPNLKNVVDKIFEESAEQRVAVLVCGPAEMAEELREHVGGWVSRGRDVWWHDESFGW